MYLALGHLILGHLILMDALEAQMRLGRLELFFKKISKQMT
jgi:hypothetical protein